MTIFKIDISHAYAFMKTSLTHLYRLFLIHIGKNHVTNQRIHSFIKLLFILFIVGNLLLIGCLMPQTSIAVHNTKKNL
jgi:hypothetical protein